VSSASLLQELQTRGAQSKFRSENHEVFELERLSRTCIADQPDLEQRQQPHWPPSQGDLIYKCNTSIKDSRVPLCSALVSVNSLNTNGESPRMMNFKIYRACYTCNISTSDVSPVNLQKVQFPKVDPRSAAVLCTSIFSYLQCSAIVILNSAVNSAAVQWQQQQCLSSSYSSCLWQIKTIHLC
jgi:hypothetical protein